MHLNGTVNFKAQFVIVIELLQELRLYVVEEAVLSCYISIPVSDCMP